MTEFMKVLEISWQESPLSKLSKELINSSYDILQIDKPISNKADVDERKETRPLTEDEINYVQNKTNWSDEQMKKCTIDNDGVVHYKCDNEHLAGKVHSPSGVEYERKTIDINGITVEVVGSKFESAFEMNLKEDLLKESNPRQFKECNTQLKEAINKDPDLRSKFTKEQLEDIMDGITPEGYTWHHDLEVGKMQLVETKLHDRTQGGAAHTGGKSLWGGGYN